MILKLPCNLLYLDMDLEKHIKLNNISVDILSNPKSIFISYFSYSPFRYLEVLKK